jgi:hypothetical protein
VFLFVKLVLEVGSRTPRITAQTEAVASGMKYYYYYYYYYYY